VLIIAVAAWILLKVIIGVLSAVAWVVAIAVAVVGVLWALSVLRR
jgi:membrane associated rhomboid family serine protease